MAIKTVKCLVMKLQKFKSEFKKCKDNLQYVKLYKFYWAKKKLK